MADARHVMLALGRFAFGMATAAYDSMQRQLQFKHSAVARVGARDAFQALGPGDDVITLSGLVAPEVTGTLASLDDLIDMGNTGAAFALVDGTGKVYGGYFIESMQNTASFFYPNGVPRRVEFSITLKRNDDTTAAGVGTGSSSASSVDADQAAAAASAVRNPTAGVLA